MNRILACIAVSLALVAGACSSSSNDSGAGANFRVNLTDAPMMGMQAVNVTITGVRVHQSASAGPGDAGWVDMPVTAAMPVDMLSIQGKLYELCSTNLPAGQYQQVRMTVQQNAGAAPPYHNSVMTMDGVVHPMAMPADMKVVHSFVVTDGTTTELTMDLQVAQSMHQQGNGQYFMTPVVGASSTMK
jgi:hypothetical protein